MAGLSNARRDENSKENTHGPFSNAGDGHRERDQAGDATNFVRETVKTSLALGWW
jgi:hypothetical protein